MPEQTERSARPGYVAGSALVLAAALAVAALPWWPIYESPEFVVLVAVATSLGFALAWLAARRRWAAWKLLTATGAAYLLFGVPLAVPGLSWLRVLPSPAGVVELLAATALAWKQLVTIVVPVGSYRSLLVPALIVFLVAATAAMTLALRTRYPSLAIVPPIVAFAAGILLGPVAAGRPVEAGLLLVVAGVLWLLWIAVTRRSETSITGPAAGVARGRGDGLAVLRTAFGTLVMAAVALAVGAAAAVSVPPASGRDVVRSHVQQPFDPRDYPSPLAGLRGYLQEPRDSAAMLTVSGLPEGAGLRIATLDTYDRVVYSVGSEALSSASGSFTRVPYRLDQPGDGERAEIEVRIEGYAGVWVPGAGALESLGFAGERAEELTDSFFYNDVTGTGAVLAGLREGDSYRMRVSLAPRAGDLHTLEPGTSVLPPFGEVPEGLDRLVERFAPADGKPGERLAGMLEGLAREGYVSHGVGPDEPFSRSGHAADRLTELATVRPMLGDAEQYAVAAAVMAREIGFPARVVFGFANTGGPGPVTVRGSDVTAWIEVQASDGSWYSIDPNPQLREIPASEPETPTIVTRPQSVLPPPPDLTRVEQIRPQPDAAPDEQPDEMPAWLGAVLAVLAVAGWTALGAAIVASPLIAVVAAKWRRRRLRKAAADPDERIDGGWDEFVDAATDYGYELPQTATRAEQAALVGGMGPLVLAAVVDRSLFAPGAGSGEDARLVWSSVDRLREELAAPRMGWERLRAAVSLRSFGRYAGRRKGEST